MKTVSEIMSCDVITVTPDTAVATVADVLVRNHLTGVPVVADGALVGIVTEADLAVREAKLDQPATVSIIGSIIQFGEQQMEEELRRILAVTADQLMTREVVTIAPEATVEDLATLMTQRKVNPVPVVDEAERIVGIVSRADLVKLVAAE